MIGRDELFALAAAPLGSPEIMAKADALTFGAKAPPEVAAISKRASKVWLPEGKSSVNTNVAREAEREMRARNFDIEDAIAAAGGNRGSAGK